MYKCDLLSKVVVFGGGGGGVGPAITTWLRYFGRVHSCSEGGQAEGWCDRNDARARCRQFICLGNP